MLLKSATDLSATLNTLHTPPMRDAANSSADVFVLSDGQITWGERDLPTLLRARTSPWSATRTFAYRTSLGAENTDLLRRVANNDIFNYLSIENMPNCAMAHQNSALRIKQMIVENHNPSNANTNKILVTNNTSNFTPNTELMIINRLDRTSPTRVHLIKRIDEQTTT